MREPGQDPTDSESRALDFLKLFAESRLHDLQEEHYEFQRRLQAGFEALAHIIPHKEQTGRLRAIKAQIIAQSQVKHRNEVVEALIVVQLRILLQNSQNYAFQQLAFCVPKFLSKSCSSYFYPGRRFSVTSKLFKDRSMSLLI